MMNTPAAPVDWPAERRKSLEQAREAGRRGAIESLGTLIRCANWCSEASLRAAYVDGARETNVPLPYYMDYGARQAELATERAGERN